MIVVDAANVVGSRPDGWWRDRAGAATRLHAAVAAALADERIDDTVVIVLEGAARSGVAATDDPRLAVVHATCSGDDAVVEIVTDAAIRNTPTTVVTADRELVSRCLAAGATSVGPRWLLDRLSPTT